MTLVFETHSTSTANEAGIASEWLDPPLSRLGITEAQEVGLRYAGAEIDAIYASDLKRAAMTADIAFGERAIHDRRLRECNYGEWAGRSSAEVEAAKARLIDDPFPAGESLSDVIGRTDEFLSGLKSANSVLVLAHRATWYSLEHLLRHRALTDVLNGRWRWRPGWIYEIPQ